MKTVASALTSRSFFLYRPPGATGTFCPTPTLHQLVGPFRPKGDDSSHRRHHATAAIADHTCGITLAVRTFCWGANGGALGTGKIAFRLTPTALGIDLSLAQVVAGEVFTCGVTTGHRAWCWGDNDTGQLGHGTIHTRLLPVPVVGPM